MQASRAEIFAIGSKVFVGKKEKGKKKSCREKSEIDHTPRP